MASTYTTRIGLEKQADGENANTWGLRLNTNVIDLVDEATAGYEAIDISGGATTLTATDGASNQARNMGLRFTGALSADTTVTIPAQEKIYFVTNDTTEDFKVLLKPAGGTLVTVTDQGTSMMAATDGSIVKILESAGGAISATSGNFSGNVRAANFFTSATLSATDIRCETVSASTRIFTPTLTATNIVAVTSINATRFTGGSVSVTGDVKGSRIIATSAVVSNGATINSIVITAGATITGVEKITTSAIEAVTVSATTIRTTTLSATGNVKGVVVSATSRVNTSAVVATTGQFTGIVSAAGFDANGTINAVDISATNINLSNRITATTATITNLVATTATVSVLKTGIVSAAQNGGRSLDIITKNDGSTLNHVAFYKDSASPSTSDEVSFAMDLNNSSGTRKRYGSIEAGSSGITSASEESLITFRALDTGTTATWLQYNAVATRPISLRATTSIGGDLYVNGTITEVSDERFKSNIQTLDGTKAFDMRGVSFERNSINDSGVIAQELELVAPELVTTDEEGYKAVAYSHVIGYLIEAVKHLKEEVETLKGNN